ncbi:MAG: carboxypeptidase-like regulatory domain-containing protein [Chitinophagaceae bacterium]
MNKKPAILLYFLFLPVFLFSQKTIKGFVVNGATGDPVAGSSVFLNSTSIGTISDKTGYFELNNIGEGHYDLIVSSVGYETTIYSFNTSQLPLSLKVQMSVKVKELENVTVEPYVKEGWDKWGLRFTDEFVGLTPNAQRCKIKNSEAIQFRYYKKSNRLVAYSDEPIIIENKALGYNIRYQLEDFEIDFSKGSCSFSGFPFFEDMDKDKKTVRHRYKEAREKAYYGSMMHFVRCLYKDSLEQNGYEVRRMVRSPNLEKQRVKNVYAAARTMTINPTTKARIFSLHLDSLQKDSTAYYDRILSQKDYKEVYGSSILTADSVIIGMEGSIKQLFFTDYLYITYKKGIEAKEYIAFSGESRSQTFQRSYVWLVEQQPIAIDGIGNYYPPQQLISMAYWAWSNKNGDLLPQDYQP